MDILKEQIDVYKRQIQDITKMKQYVLSIISDNYNEGCGVMVGDMFITAGHVISKCENPRIRWNGKRIASVSYTHLFGQICLRHIVHRE